MPEAEFSRDCERWRIWAQTNLAGTAMQLASAGDAAALTGWLGSQDNADAIAAARAAAALDFDAAPRSATWARTGYAIQTPDVAFERLAEAGWEPVPQTGHRRLAPHVKCFATWTAERRVGKMETLEVKSVAERVGEEIGFWAPDSLIGSFIGEAVLGGIGAAIGGDKTETKRVWKNTGKFQFYVLHDCMLFVDGGKASQDLYSEFMAMEFTPEPKEAVQVLVKDNVFIQFQGTNARLISKVLEKKWRQYWTGRLSERGRARKAIADRMDPVESPPEALSLAHSFRDLGYLQRAIEYFEIATMSADPIVAADAFGTLGSIWLKQRDFARARECYARSAELGDQNVRPWALKNLALTERELGHWDAAVADFNRVIETKHSDYSPSAMMLLGATYELNLNDLVAARREYERAIESGHPDYGPRSAYLCALVIRRLGDNAAAVKTLQRAATSGHKDHGPSAKYLLARWYGLDWNDPVTGRRLLEEVVATGHSEWAPKAKELLSKRPFAGVIVRQ